MEDQDLLTTLTRTQLYEARDAPIPNCSGHDVVATARCQHCGKPLVGAPASKRWCSESCRRQHRREQASPPPLASVKSPRPSAAPLEGLSELVEMIGCAMHDSDVVAVTIETANGLAVTIGRVGA
jgi:hypothetical protein